MRAISKTEVQDSELLFVCKHVIQVSEGSNLSAEENIAFYR